MKNLLVLNVDEKIDKANKVINNINNNLFTLYLNNNIFNKNLKYKLLDDLFKPEYASKIDKHARLLAKTWYKPIEKQLRYFRIPLPELMNLEFIKIWPILLKIEILTRLIRKEKPSKIYVITEYEEDIRILNELVKNKKIVLEANLLEKSNKFSIKRIPKNISYKFITKLQNSIFKLYLLKHKIKNNILFLGNLRQNINLFKKLKENPENKIIRGGENLGRGLFNKYCDYYITFKDFSSIKINNKINEEGIKLINKWNKIKLDKELRKKLYYKISLYNILEPYLDKIVLERFTDFMKYIEIMKNIGNKIDVVVTHNDVLAFEKTIVKAANNLKIPTLTMIEGFLPIKQIKKGTQFIPFTAKKMAVHSEAQKQAIITKGIQRNKLFITGYPDFDKYFNFKPIKKELIYKKYNIPLDKKIVLYVGERYTKNKYESSIWAAQNQEQYKNVYSELFKTIKEFPDLFLIIKKHPSGSLDERIIRNLSRKENFNNYVIISDMNIYSLLNASYAVINRLSTMALEAMFLRKPVIVMDTYFDTNDNFDYTQFNAALHAKKPGDLKKLLKLLYDEDIMNKLKQNMDKFVNYNYVNDGKASERMANLINKLIKN